MYYVNSQLRSQDPAPEARRSAIIDQGVLGGSVRLLASGAPQCFKERTAARTLEEILRDETVILYPRWRKLA